MKTAAILMALGLLGCVACGCRGMGGGPDEMGRSTFKVYELNNYPDSRCVIIIGSAGTQAPMYQGGEAEAGTGEGSGCYVQGPAMPASGGQNAATGSGKYVQANAADSVKRTAETDASMAAALAAGLQQSQQSLTAPQAMRQSSGSANPTNTSSPTQTSTTSIAPAASVAPGGLANTSQTAPNASPGQNTASATQTQTAPAAAQPAAGVAAETELQAAEKELANAKRTAELVGTGGVADGTDTPAQASAKAAVVTAQAKVDALKK